MLSNVMNDNETKGESSHTFVGMFRETHIERRATEIKKGVLRKGEFECRVKTSRSRMYLWELLDRELKKG